MKKKMCVCVYIYIHTHTHTCVFERKDIQDHPEEKVYLCFDWKWEPTREERSVNEKESLS